MPRLSEITKETRLLSKIGGVIFVVFLLLFFSFKGYGLLKKTFFPTPPPPPEMGFGKIAQLQFPESNAIVPSTYTVNTIDGTLPSTPDRLNVYVVSTPSASLLSLEDAQQSAARVGFDSSSTKISDTVYQWANGTTGSTLTYDIVTKNFNINGNLFNTNVPITDEGQVTGTVNSFLNQIGTNTDDVDSDKTQIIYLQNSNGQIVGAEKNTQANLARVNLYQKNLGEVTIGGTKEALNIYYPYADRTLLSFVVGASGNDLAVLQGEFINRNIMTENYSSYPIITTQQAYDNLQKGNAYIVANPNNQESIDISDVTLGYYIGPDFGVNPLGQNIKHIQPIYVFKGLNGFIGYVPAVAPSAVCESTGC